MNAIEKVQAVLILFITFVVFFLFGTYVMDRHDWAGGYYTEEQEASNSWKR